MLHCTCTYTHELMIPGIDLLLTVIGGVDITKRGKGDSSFTDSAMGTSRRSVITETGVSQFSEVRQPIDNLFKSMEISRKI